MPKLTDADKKTVDAIRDALRDRAFDDDAESIVTSARYDEIAGVVDDTVKKSTKGMSTTQKIDRVVTNRFPSACRSSSSSCSSCTG